MKYGVPCLPVRQIALAALTIMLIVPAVAVGQKTESTEESKVQEKETESKKEEASKEEATKKSSAETNQESARSDRRRQRRPRGRRGRVDNAPKIGQAAPDFTLKSLDGKSETKLSAFKGKKPVILFFGSYT